MRTVTLLRALLLAAIVGPTAILAAFAWTTRRQAFDDARHELLWTSEVGREHASKVFDSYRLVADRVQDTLAAPIVPTPGEDVLHARFRAMIASLPQIQSLLVLDRTGHAVVATEADPVDRSTDFTDRDYFQALKARAVSTFVSRVQDSRITGKRFFGWGRARRTVDGDFDGVIDLAISPAYFSGFYETLISEVGDDPAGRIVTMIRSDGQILVRYPPLPGPPPMVPAGNPFFAALAADPESGVYINRSVVDRGAPARLFAFRKVPDHPIYIVAGRSLDAITAEWRRGLIFPLLFGLFGAIALFLVTLAALRGSRREREALDQARAEMGRREAAEDQLRQSQKMEAIGQLTGGVAHDFNNLLTVIQSSVDLLQRPNLADDRRRRYVAAIADTAARAARLTSQLLAFARRQALNPEIFDVADAVRSVGDMLGTLMGSRIRVTIQVPDRACLVNADASQFDTVLVNLAVNARDAMNGEGALAIRVDTALAGPTIRGRPGLAGDFVTVSTTDTGSGIPAEDLGRIFEPFFTTKAVGRGTGLGLSQVFGFVRQSGGEVTVVSDVGRGTTFTLYLPHVIGDAPPRLRNEGEDGPADGHGTCVLLVEDNADVGSFARQTLAELGYQSVLAVDAERALVELATGKDRFDVVFSDVVMPGMNGIELGQEIRRRHPGLPVVLTSGYSHVLAERGTDGFELLHKPYSIDQLSRVLQQAVLRQPLRNLPRP